MLSILNTKSFYLTVSGQAVSKVLPGEPRPDDPQPERPHPSCHRPDGGAGAPQPVRRQGGLSEQPGPVGVVAMGGAADRRRR